MASSGECKNTNCTPSHIHRRWRREKLRFLARLCSSDYYHKIILISCFGHPRVKRLTPSEFGSVKESLLKVVLIMVAVVRSGV